MTSAMTATRTRLTALLTAPAPGVTLQPYQAPATPRRMPRACHPASSNARASAAAVSSSHVRTPRPWESPGVETPPRPAPTSFSRPGRCLRSSPGATRMARATALCPGTSTSLSTAVPAGLTVPSQHLVTVLRLLARDRVWTSTWLCSTCSIAVELAPATEVPLMALTSGFTTSPRRLAPASATRPPSLTLHAPATPRKASARMWTPRARPSTQLAPAAASTKRAETALASAASLTPPFPSTAPSAGLTP
mmetsp:Transcript_88231/g.156422  ORF Transcript_88231/g.156422 Transcript_88231/m.156422 type:complete len:250 (+) Transcript_88231:125-874(+)